MESEEGVKLDATDESQAAPTDGLAVDVTSRSADVKVRFIPDEAVDTDFFGSHQKVASALAEALRDNPKLRVVGLLGPWGSGKSTVVRLLEREMGSVADGPRFFTYDAWLHQSDPPKRAFLERFDDFLIAQRLATRETWAREIDLLNRRIEETDVTTTPHLTRIGGALLLSLLLVPVGTRFAAADWAKVAGEAPRSDPAHWVFWLGLLLSIGPLLLAALIYYHWRPTRLPWKKAWRTAANWSAHREPHQNESILSVIANRAVQRQTSTTTKSPEPTMMEFQRTLRKLLSTARGDDRPLVVVVDNLDRLPDADAVEMWTTIRGLFLGASDAVDGPPERGIMPAIVVPIDESAIARMYGDEEAKGRDLARSFMDKTFDVTFHVTPPVLSDWNAYLTRRLTTVFGVKIADAWSLDVGRIYARSIRGMVTPRDLNRVVDAVAALWLQWASSEIPFPTIAYYAIRRRELEADFVRETSTTLIDLAEHDPDWRRSLAAIRFGVPVADALQILLAPELEDAISRGDDNKFARQLAFKGFDRVLLRMLDEGSVDERQLPNLAKLLGRAKTVDEPWAAAVWKKIRRSAETIDPVALGSENTGSLLGDVVAHVPAADGDAFLAAFARAMRSIAIARAGSASSDTFVAVAIRWLELAEGRKGIATPLNIADANVYLTTAGAARRAGRGLELLRSEAEEQALVDAFVKRLNELSPFATIFEQAEIVLSLDLTKVDRVPLIAAAQTITSGQSITHPTYEAAVHVLGSLRREYKQADAGVTDLANSGVLEMRTEEAFDAENSRLAARLAALSIIKGISVQAPVAAGWGAALKADQSLLPLIDSGLMDYGDSAFSKAIVQFASGSTDGESLGQALILRRLDDQALGGLYVKDIISDHRPYTKLVPKARQPELVAEFSQYQTFWELLGDAWNSESGLDLLEWLIGSGFPHAGNRKRARSELRTWLKSVPQATWTTELRDSGRLLETAERLHRLEGRTLALGTALSTALREELPRMTEHSDEAVAARWFRAVALLSADGRRTLLRGVRDRLNAISSTVDPLPILRQGGLPLLKDADFPSTADTAVRHVVISLVATDDGVNWLAEHGEAVGSWVFRANRSSRAFLEEQMKERAANTAGPLHERLVELIDMWSARAA